MGSVIIVLNGKSGKPKRLAVGDFTTHGVIWRGRAMPLLESSARLIATRTRITDEYAKMISEGGKTGRITTLLKIDSCGRNVAVTVSGYCDPNDYMYTDPRGIRRSRVLAYYQE